MPDQDLLRRVRDLLIDQFGADRFGASPIDRSSRLFDELGLTSLEIVSVLTELESTVGLDLPRARIPITELSTVGDLMDQIRGEAGRTTRDDPLLDSLARGASRRRKR